VRQGKTKEKEEEEENKPRKPDSTDGTASAEKVLHLALLQLAVQVRHVHGRSTHDCACVLLACGRCAEVAFLFQRKVR
jgi:hypothetical protein